MKVGFISNHSFLRPGGVKAHILSLKDEFEKRGIETKVVIPRRKKSENYDKDIIFLGRSIPISFKGTEADFSFALNFKKISKVLKGEKFDILHFHNLGILGYQILKKSKALNILTIHTGYKRSEILREKENIWDAPYSSIPKEILKKFSSLPIDYLIGKVKKRMNGAIAVSSPCLDFCEGYSGPKTVIPNGVDLERFNPKNKKIKKFQDSKYLNILFLGRIEERKGLIYLLKAYKILEKNSFFQGRFRLRLIIVGDGPLKANCLQFVKKYKLKNVIFEGESSHKKTPSYFATADIFVSPAVFGESFGIVLLEAMASGCPIVAFGNKGYKTVMQGKYKDFLVKPKDFVGLARKIELLIKSPKKRKEMKEFGLKLAKKYSWRKVADRILDFYEFCQTFKQSEKTSYHKRDYLKKIGRKIVKKIIDNF